MPRTSHRNPVEELADEFVARFRRGERPAISEYALRHPEHAAEIVEVFPALVMMEQVDSDLKHAAEADTPAADPVPAHTQLGDFRIIRETGRGGMGIVYEAEQVSLGRRVALKVLPKQTLLDSKHQKRFLREAKAAARLHHTNIVPVFGVGQQDGLHFYVMQFIHGLGLDEVLVELQRMRDDSQASGGRKPTDSALIALPAAAVAHSLLTGRFERTLLVESDESDQPSAVSHQQTTQAEFRIQNRKSRIPAHTDTVVGQLSDTLPGHNAQSSRSHSRQIYWHSVARIGVQAAEALQYAHDQGVIHRDVKPGNLLLDTRGSVWVTDFGLAKAADQQDLTHTGDVLGTLRYMAPEQFDGKADARSDVYALGLTLYELLALQPGFDEKDRHKLIKQVTTGAPARLRTLDPHIPRDLETIVHKAIDRDASHRYQTAGELAADLKRYLGDEPIRARWISPVTRFARWCKRNPAVAGLTSTIAALLVIAAIVSSMTAVRFEILATEKANLASERGDLVASLNTALGDATSEQKRAQGNLDLALQALDAVYLDAIGEQKLLGRPRSAPGWEGSGLHDSRIELSDLERELLQKGLTFYDEFVSQNQNSPAAAVQTAEAYYRVALLQGALDDGDGAAQNFSEAINRYQALIRNEPDNHRHRARLAMAYFGLASLQPRWPDAERNFRLADSAMTAALARNQDVANYYYQRSNIRFSLGDYTHAQQDAERAVELAPTDVLFLIEAAHKSIRPPRSYKHIDRAVALCERAIDVDPNSALAHRSLGAALSYTDKSRALEHLTESIRLDPTFPGAFNQRARIYMARGEYDQALADATEAIRNAPHNGTYYGTRTEIFVQMHRFADARADINTALELYPPGLPFHANLLSHSADLYARTGDLERAESELTRAITQAPLVPWNYANRLRVRLQLEKYGAARDDLKSLLELTPADMISVSLVLNVPDDGFQQDVLNVLTELIDSPETDDLARGHYHRHRSQLLLAMERWEEARQEFGTLLDLDHPQSSHSDHYTHALLCLTLSDDVNFLAGCRAMLQAFAETEDLDAASFAAWTCSVIPDAVEDYATALRLARQAAEGNPDNNQYLNTLGAVLYRAGRHDEAQEQLSALAERLGQPERDAESSPACTWYFLAMSHHALGQTEAAQAWLAKANDWTENVLADEQNPLPWNRKLILKLLRDEANSLIAPNNEAAGSEQDRDGELPLPPPSAQRSDEVDN